MEDRDYLVRFIDSGGVIFIAESAREAVWRVEGRKRGMIFGEILQSLRSFAPQGYGSKQ